MECGKSYHVKNEFYTMVRDPHLMQNKENGNYRPHVYCFPDTRDSRILWAIPQTTQVEKFKGILAKKLQYRHECSTIVIGLYGGKENAFLIQNMFPLIEKYFDHEHTICGVPVQIHEGLKRELETKAKRVLSLHRQGMPILFCDVNRIYQMMKNELDYERV